MQLVNKSLVKQPEIEQGIMKIAPFVHNERLLLLESIGADNGDYDLQIKDAETGDIVSRFTKGYGLASALIHEESLYVFASRYENGTWNDVTVFYSSDLKQWNSKVVIEQKKTEHLSNTSVCKAGDRFVMAYEIEDAQYISAKTILFAESKDLLNWAKLPNVFSNNGHYIACPCLRHLEGYFYLLYVEQISDGQFALCITRSSDLIDWEHSPRNPIITGEDNEGNCVYEPDLVEFENKVCLYYTVGDQNCWTGSKKAIFEGTIADFLHWCYTHSGLHYAAPECLWRLKIIKGPYRDLPPLSSAQEHFKDLKFGIFIHWGLYSILGHGEWAVFKENIPFEVYDKQADIFKAEDFNAREWVQLIKESGAQYTTFTTKHHDGYSLFDSQFSNHTTAKTGSHRDFVAEFSEACAESKMQLNFYYSLLDWRYPEFTPHLPDYTRYMEGQVEELCTRYGKVGGFWFDMGALLESYHGEKVWETIRREQPNAVIMPCDFIVCERDMNYIGYYDSEGRIVGSPTPDPSPDFWPIELCDTMNDNWGYTPADTNYRSSEDLIWQLVMAVGRGANLNLNISPTPSGTIPWEQVERLKAIGDFLKTNGEAIYGTRPANLPKQTWGYAVTKESKTYLHVLDQSQAEIMVQGLNTKVTSVHKLGGRAVDWSLNDNGLKISLPPESLEPIDTVIEIISK